MLYKYVNMIYKFTANKEIALNKLLQLVSH